MCRPRCFAPRQFLPLLLLCLFLAACTPAMVRPLPTAYPTAPPLPAAIASLSAANTSPSFLPATYTAVPSWEPTLTPLPTQIPSITPTPDLYRQYTIEYLAGGRFYGNGQPLQIERTLATTEAFTRSLITYGSDDLTVYGFMNTPTTPGPHPVVLVLHGYIPPAEYQTIGYTAPYADALAQAGYVAIHPNYRNYPPSDSGPNLFRIGYAIDVLNLMAHVRQQAGQSGPLQTADPNRLHLLGHSMGGGVALRVLTISRDVTSAVLYGAMSGDERQNYEKIIVWSGGEDGERELNFPEEALQRISPIYALDRITARVSLHHGAADTVVPPAWSADLCARLQAMAKPVECFTYTNQPHNFTGTANQQFIQRAIAFFDS